MSEANIDAEVHESVKIGLFCIIGHPSRDGNLDDKVVRILEGCNIRSHTIIYEGVRIGKRVETGHGVLIREKTSIGDDCSIGTNSVLEHSVELSSRVRIHSNVFLPEYTKVDEDAWIGPNVVLTNSKYPNSEKSKERLSGVLVGKKAIIGANATVLPGINIEEGAIIGAGSMVNRDVHKNQVVVGNPCRVVNSRGNIVHQNYGRLYGD